jgi:hypothetical protein
MITDLYIKYYIKTLRKKNKKIYNNYMKFLIRLKYHLILRIFNYFVFNINNSSKNTNLMFSNPKSEFNAKSEF